MAKALYHQHGKTPLSFHVVATDDDGNLHLSPTAGGKATLLSVPIAEKPTVGHVTVDKAELKAIAALGSAAAKAKAVAAKKEAEALEAAAKAQAEAEAKAAAEAEAEAKAAEAAAASASK